MYLPVLEKTKSTLIVFSDQDTFKDLGKNEYFNMLHIDVKIHKSVVLYSLAIVLVQLLTAEKETIATYSAQPAN